MPSSDSYEYSTISGLFHLGGDPNMPGLSMDEITNGQFTYSGGNVVSLTGIPRDPQTGQLLGSGVIGRYPDPEGFTITKAVLTDPYGVPHDEYAFGTPRLTGAVNSDTFAASFYSAVIENSVIDFSGIHETINQDFIGLTAHGAKLYIQEGAVLQKGKYLDVVPGDSAPPGFRPANEDETIRYGVGSYLLDKYYGLLTNLVAAGFTDGNGDIISDQYSLAHYLAGQVNVRVGRSQLAVM